MTVYPMHIQNSFYFQQCFCVKIEFKKKWDVNFLEFLMNILNLVQHTKSIRKAVLKIFEIFDNIFGWPKLIKICMNELIMNNGLFGHEESTAKISPSLLYIKKVDNSLQNLVFVLNL